MQERVGNGVTWQLIRSGVAEPGLVVAGVGVEGEFQELVGFAATAFPLVVRCRSHNCSPSSPHPAPGSPARCSGWCGGGSWPGCPQSDPHDLGLAGVNGFWASSGGDDPDRIFTDRRYDRSGRGGYEGLSDEESDRRCDRSFEDTRA